jgi:hypothetical protein
MGRALKLPPQLGHIPFNTSRAHSIQNVHSKVQMTASGDSGGSAFPQHSQKGRSSSMARTEVGRSGKIVSRRARMDGRVSTPVGKARRPHPARASSP